MKQLIAMSLQGLMLLGITTTLQAQSADATAEKEVAALEKTWTESQKTNNPDLIAPLIAEKFQYTTSDGKLMNKAEFLADAKATKYTSVVYTEETVTVFGNTAIARGKTNNKGTDSAGKNWKDSARYTDVWVKMPDQKWLCVSSQDSTVKK